MEYTNTFSQEQLIKTDLPPMPGNVLRITQMLGDMSVSQTTIARAISLDPILTSRILSRANSVTYAPERPVTNLPAAVSAIGNNSISETLLISGISDSFGRKVLSSPTGKAIWAHLLATGMAASDMCRLAGLRGADEAFSCGLLHDIGKLIFLRADSPFYLTLLVRADLEGDLLEIEQAAFGFDHAELGAAAAAAWNLPDPICDMIRFHHDPSKATSGMAITRIVNIADSLAYLKLNDLPIDDLLYSESVLGFGFSVDQFDTLWENVVVRMNEVTGTFS